ncbi:MAG: shikimate kinase, partial [Methanomicrobium sp.]|nr:shikimate kinase [Methanomicrobium sp.]
MIRVVLIGFRGSGKTTVGGILAKRLGQPFIDTDTGIVKKSGMPIEEIFRDYGEAHFRKLEREVIAALPESDCVVATGGGCVQSAENAANLRHESLVFFLDVSPEVSYGRISESSRPALTDKDPVDEVK